MEASHKKHRSHIKVEKDAEEEKAEGQEHMTTTCYSHINEHIDTAKIILPLNEHSYVINRFTRYEF